MKRGRVSGSCLPEEQSSLPVPCSEDHCGLTLPSPEKVLELRYSTF